MRMVGHHHYHNHDLSFKPRTTVKTVSDVHSSKSSVDKFLLAGTGNAMVRYRIVEGDTTGNFSIDSVTGEVGWIQM